MLGLLLGIAGFILTLGTIAAIAYLTVSYLKNFRDNKDSTVVAMDMKEIIKDIKKTKSGKRMSFDELEALEEQAEKTPIIFAECDSDDDVLKVEGAETAESRIESLLKQEGILTISD